MNQKIKKSESDKKYFNQITKEFLKDKNLLIEKKYSHVCLLFNQKNEAISDYWIDEFNAEKIHNISFDIKLEQLSKFKNYYLKEEILNNNWFEILNKIIKYEYLDYLREHVSQNQFIHWLDKKILNDKYNISRDEKFFIDYLKINQPNDLFSYVARPKFIIKNYALIDSLFDNCILEQLERVTILNIAIDCSLLNSKNNKNLFYQLNNKYIKAKSLFEVFFEEYKNKNDFLTTCIEKTYKINIEFDMLNIYNLQNREHVIEERMKDLIKKGVSNILNYKTELEISDIAVFMDKNIHCLYCTGNMSSTILIEKVLHEWFTKALTQKSFDDSYLTPMLPTEVMHAKLETSLLNKPADKKIKV